MPLAFICHVYIFQETLLNSAWGIMENKTKGDLETQLNCCGLFNTTGKLQQFNQDLGSCRAVSLKYHIFSLTKEKHSHGKTH